MNVSNVKTIHTDPPLASSTSVQLLLTIQQSVECSTHLNVINGGVSNA